MPQASPDAASALERCTMDELRSTVAGCTLCDLSSTRTHAVPGTGDTDARVMVLLDAPGYFDDRSGSTLTGPGATSLERFLSRAGLSRDEIVITYCVKCRPPESRGPSQTEVTQCEGYLFRELALVAPQVVCAAGSLPARILTSQAGSVSRRRGLPSVVTVQGRDIVVLPVYDPRVACHTDGLDAQLSQDGTLLAQLLEQLDGGAAAATVVADVGEAMQSPGTSDAGGDEARRRDPAHHRPRRDNGAAVADDGDTQLSLDIG